MSLTELMLVVGLWAIWMGMILVLLHGLGGGVGPAGRPLARNRRGGRGDPVY